MNIPAIAIVAFIAIIVFGSLSGCAQVDPCARGCTSATVEYEAGHGS